jgi:hypothetical protein
VFIFFKSKRIFQSKNSNGYVIGFIVLTKNYLPPLGVVYQRNKLFCGFYWRQAGKIPTQV